MTCRGKAWRYGCRWGGSSGLGREWCRLPALWGSAPPSAACLSPCSRTPRHRVLPAERPEEPSRGLSPSSANAAHRRDLSLVCVFVSCTLKCSPLLSVSCLFRWKMLIIEGGQKKV